MSRASAAASESTIVVNLVGDPVHGLLAESRFVDRTFLPGGEHNLYELAFAAAQAGFRVELRGWLERRAFEAFQNALGIAPVVGLPARPPVADDIVVIPEGWGEPMDYGSLLLSPARLAMFVLAPPGLFGWSFDASKWIPPDPLTVALDAVATPSQFRAIHDLGIFLLTHSAGIVAAAADAGVPCCLVGTGRPYAHTDGPRGVDERPTDVAALLANRWAPLVRAVAGELNGVRLDLIGEIENIEVMARLARSRVLLWPSRIEGHATIPWEARSVGCVPVALSTNRFAVGLTEADGAVLVDTIDEMPSAVRDLVGNTARWRELSDRARTHAREESDWDRYVERVRSALLAIPTARPGQPALAGIGSALRSRQTETGQLWQTRLEELTAELERVIADRDRLAGIDAELERVRADRDRLATYVAKLERYSGLSLARRARSLGKRAEAKKPD